MRPIRRNPLPNDPLDVRLRLLLPLIIEDNERRIANICTIAAKPSLSAEDFEVLKENLRGLKPTLLDLRLLDAFLTEIGVEIGRDKRTLKRLIEPAPPPNWDASMDSLRPGQDQSPASLHTSTPSITSRSQAAAEEMYGRRIQHVVRAESQAEYRQRAGREARAEFPPGESGSHPDALPFAVYIVRELRISRSDLLDALSAP
jgi:hypothetical protein